MRSKSIAKGERSYLLLFFILFISLEPPFSSHFCPPSFSCFSCISSFPVIFFSLSLFLFRFYLFLSSVSFFLTLFLFLFLVFFPGFIVLRISFCFLFCFCFVLIWCCIFHPHELLFPSSVSPSECFHSVILGHRTSILRMISCG